MSDVKMEFNLIVKFHISFGKGMEGFFGSMNCSENKCSPLVLKAFLELFPLFN